MRHAGISLDLLCVISVLVALTGAGATAIFVLVPPWSSVLIFLVIIGIAGFAWLAGRVHSGNKQRDAHAEDDKQGIRLGPG
jgi:hypothetical protein